MAGGGKLLGGRGCRKRQGGRGKKGGGRGLGDGGGEGGGERGWGEALIEVLNKTGIVTLSLVIVKHFTRRNRPKIAIFEGNPRFFGESPVMTSRSREYVIISPEKSPKMRCAGDFT